MKREMIGLGDKGLSIRGRLLRDQHVAHTAARRIRFSKPSPPAQRLLGYWKASYSSPHFAGSFEAAPESAQETRRRRILNGYAH